MFCTVTASMVVNGREAVRAIGAFSEAPAHDFGLQHHGIALTEVPSFEQCTRRTPEGEMVPLALMSKLDMRLHPDDRGFATGQPNGVPRIRGWFAFAGWVPTVEFTVHVRAMPSPGPLRCEFTTKEIQGGMFEEDGVIWDENGTLIAQSRQIGLIPL
jgi:hypothetical protein